MRKLTIAALLLVGAFAFAADQYYWIPSAGGIAGIFDVKSNIVPVESAGSNLGTASKYFHLLYVDTVYGAFSIGSTLDTSKFTRNGQATNDTIKNLGFHNAYGDTNFSSFFGGRGGLSYSFGDSGWVRGPFFGLGDSAADINYMYGQMLTRNRAGNSNWVTIYRPDLMVRGSFFHSAAKLYGLGGTGQWNQAFFNGEMDTTTTAFSMRGAEIKGTSKVTMSGTSQLIGAYLKTSIGGSSATTAWATPCYSILATDATNTLSLGYNFYAENSIAGTVTASAILGTHPTNSAWTYGCDFNDATFATADFRLQNGATIQNGTAGRVVVAEDTIELDGVIVGIHDTLTAGYGIAVKTRSVGDDTISIDTTTLDSRYSAGTSIALWRSSFRAGQFTLAPDSAPAMIQNDSTNFSWYALAFDQTAMEIAYILDATGGYALTDTIDSIGVAIYWTANSATPDTVQWDVGFIMRGDGQLFDSTIACGYINDENEGQGLLNVAEANFSLTVSNSDDLISFRIDRDPSVAGNLAADAQLVMVRFTYYKATSVGQPQ